MQDKAFDLLIEYWREINSFHTGDMGGSARAHKRKWEIESRIKKVKEKGSQLERFCEIAFCLGYLNSPTLPQGVVLEMIASGDLKNKWEGAKEFITGLQKKDDKNL